ncbi:hypothetical protein OOT00_00280 [Desulfobotulus sp. H1]|uniref:Uncharacterized protein n=1 Tax=Desulfobotulus pelophilus TaxID=2823377 RepID=A0ABT3N4N4_9BACT|nr:hypothetical protein [Desulfobotulus pelophilus]MCW7752420.1 hypothetical protein [Desulfobotulus pelophilus]
MDKTDVSLCLQNGLSQFLAKKREAGMLLFQEKDLLVTTADTPDSPPYPSPCSAYSMIRQGNTILDP